MICPHGSMVKGGTEPPEEAVVGGEVAGGTDERVVVVLVVVVRTGEEAWGEFVQLLAARATMITAPATTVRGRIS